MLRLMAVNAEKRPTGHVSFGLGYSIWGSNPYTDDDPPSGVTGGGEGGIRLLGNRLASPWASIIPLPFTS